MSWARPWALSIAGDPEGAVLQGRLFAYFLVAQKVGRPPGRIPGWASRGYQQTATPSMAGTLVVASTISGADANSAGWAWAASQRTSKQPVVHAGFWPVAGLSSCARQRPNALWDINQR